MIKIQLMKGVIIRAIGGEGLKKGETLELDIMLNNKYVEYEIVRDNDCDYIIITRK